MTDVFINSTQFWDGKKNECEGGGSKAVNAHRHHIILTTNTNNRGSVETAVHGWHPRGAHTSAVIGASGGGSAFWVARKGPWINMDLFRGSKLGNGGAVSYDVTNLVL